MPFSNLNKGSLWASSRRLISSYLTPLSISWLVPNLRRKASVINLAPKIPVPLLGRWFWTRYCARHLSGGRAWVNESLTLKSSLSRWIPKTTEYLFVFIERESSMARSRPVPLNVCILGSHSGSWGTSQAWVKLCEPGTGTVYSGHKGDRAVVDVNGHKFLTYKCMNFPAGWVLMNPPASAGDMGSIPAPGRSHKPWGDYAGATTNELVL